MLNEIGGSRKGLYQTLFVVVVLIVLYHVVAIRNISKNEIVPAPTPTIISAQ